MSDSPSAVAAAYSMLRARRVRRPRPAGAAGTEHADLAEVLASLRADGVAGLSAQRTCLATYRSSLETIDPDDLTRAESLAFWLNLYNAGALDLAAETHEENRPSVLRTPGAFDKQWATIAGERLSLNDIEHGKVRRFGDPRIHGALVCGSASCPTLRLEPYTGAGLEDQLERQMRSFMAGGGAVRDGDTLLLSRIFLWYGADFVWPHRMPTVLPVTKKALQRAVARWLEPELHKLPVGFQSYDWSLGCSIA